MEVVEDLGPLATIDLSSADKAAGVLDPSMNQSQADASKEEKKDDNVGPKSEEYPLEVYLMFAQTRNLTDGTVHLDGDTTSAGPPDGEADSTGGTGAD